MDIILFVPHLLLGLFLPLALIIGGVNIFCIVIPVQFVKGIDKLYEKYKNK